MRMRRPRHPFQIDAGEDAGVGFAPGVHVHARQGGGIRGAGRSDGVGEFALHSSIEVVPAEGFVKSPRGRLRTLDRRGWPNDHPAMASALYMDAVITPN